LQDRIFPVCAPDVAAQITQAEDLAAQTLLHDSTWADDWETWLSHAAPQVSGRSGPTYSLFSVAVEEACNGAGVLIAHEALVDAKLAQGTLVAPLEPKMALPRHLIMQVAPGFRSKPEYALLQKAMA